MRQSGIRFGRFRTAITKPDGMDSDTGVRSQLLLHPRRDEIVEVSQHLLFPIHELINGVGILHTKILCFHSSSNQTGDSPVCLYSIPLVRLPIITISVSGSYGCSRTWA